MKKILIAIILTSSILSCEKEDVQPTTKQEQTQCNDVCKCGEVLFSNTEDGSQWYYDVVNDCSGEQQRFYGDSYIAEGLTYCADVCW